MGGNMQPFFHHSSKTAKWGDSGPSNLFLKKLVPVRPLWHFLCYSWYILISGRITWQISRKLREQSWLLQKFQKVLKFKYSETSKENFHHFLSCTLVYKWCICYHVCADSSGARTGALTQMLENESGSIWRPGKTCMCVFLTFIHTSLLVDIVHFHSLAKSSK